MPDTSSNSGESSARDGWFSPTHWSVVVKAGRPGTAEAEAALARLCQTYWYPLYTFVRRSGKSMEDAQDLTQEFFARLVEKNFVGAAERDKGRFRSFLLIALKRFLANEWDRANRLKRGGGRVLISLDEEKTESRYQAEPVDAMTPDRLYERQWALTLLEAARDRLREQWLASGKGAQFEHLKRFLADETGTAGYSPVAKAMNIPEATVAVMVYRLRQKYRELVRTEVAHTLEDPADIDNEMQHLLTALGSSS